MKAVPGFHPADANLDRMSTEQGLSAQSLACRRSGRLLFQDLSFHAQPGRLFEICGANGSGKTTLLRLLCGLRQPDEGLIEWQGHDVHKNTELFRQSLCYVGHMQGIKADLNPLENLRCDALLSGADPGLAESALKKIGLESVMTLPTRQLSAGQRQRVALARLLVRRAELWILDEPCASLDRSAQQQVQDLLEAQASRGGTVIFTTHQPLHFRQASVEQLWLGEAG